MDLACTEFLGGGGAGDNNSGSKARYAQKDSAIFHDARVLENLLNEEHLSVPTCNYFETVQTDVQPFMRKVVSTWMSEVCEEQMCEDQIFPLSINLMDRFLSVCNIKRSQLQLLGATCLLLASKTRSSSYLPIDLLCAYTDYSVTPEHILSWEMLVLSKLQWNMSAVTAFDYIEQIISRNCWSGQNELLRRHAHTLISICCTETNLIRTPPSMIAAACVVSAYRGLKLHSANSATREICNLTRVDPIMLESLVQFVDSTIEKVVVQSPEEEKQPPACKYVSGGGEFESPTYGQPETPTDVENVHF